MIAVSYTHLLGNLPALSGTIDGLYIEKSVLEILQEIIEVSTAATGKNFFMRVRNGALNIYEYPQILTFAKHRFEAGNELDITYALGSVDGSDLSLIHIYSYETRIHFAPHTHLLEYGFNHVKSGKRIVGRHLVAKAQDSFGSEYEKDAEAFITDLTKGW